MIHLSDPVVDHLLTVGDDLDLGGTKYRYRGKVGEGGMGEVYMVEDTELGREVALKVVSGPHPERLAERLRTEARVIARLEHPGIVPVHDIGHLPDGRLFYVMKLVRGERLDAWSKSEPRPAVLRLFQRICEAVAFAHAHGVIHRDLKPQNVMVGPFGEALVMDWGLTKQLDVPPPRVLTMDSERPPDSLGDAELGDTVPSAATADGTVMGTPAFMPPEQARGEIDALDQRSDIYALGAILYTLLASRPPFEGDDGRAIIERVIASEPEPLDPGLPRPLVSICARAMAKDPAGRYATAQALSDDIGHFIDGLPVHAHRETVMELVARFVSRHRVLITLLAAYLIVRVALALLVPG